MSRRAFSLSLSLVTEIGSNYTEKRTPTAIGNLAMLMATLGKSNTLLAEVHSGLVFRLCGVCIELHIMYITRPR